jgi:ELWxxDGT repeat protein
MVRSAGALVALGAVVAALGGQAAAGAEDRDDRSRERVSREGLTTVVLAEPSPGQAPPPSDPEPPPAGGPQLKPGFPVDVHSGGGSYMLGSSSVVVGDIDGDAGLEVLVSGLAAGRIVAVEPDGSPVRGWPTTHAVGAGYLGLVEADVARPGLEVSVVTEDRVLVLDGHGQPLTGWPQEPSNYGSQALSAADLTGDRRDEVAYNPQDWGYSVLDAQGRAPAGTSWPRRTDVDQMLSQPGIADLDHDGDQELMGGGADYDEEGPNFVGFDGSGASLPGWSHVIERFSHTRRVAIGELDGDPDLEVAVPGPGAFGPDGSQEHWFAVHGHQPALGDLDGDGDDEVVMMVGDIWARQGDSTDLLPGFPVATPAVLGWAWIFPPVVADLDNDGHQDVIVSGETEDGQTVVHAVSRAGVALPGFPMVLPIRQDQAIAAADIDGNGRTDLLVAGSDLGVYSGWYPGLFAYEYPSGQAAPPDWSQYGGGPRHQFAVGQSLGETPGPPAGASRPGHLAQVADLVGGGDGAAPRGLTPVADRLVFTADTPGAGREPWVSDGTVAGTTRLVDALAGPASSQPDELTAAGDQAYLVLDDGVHGRELWRTDGTPAGTTLVTDLVPGAEGSGPAELTAVAGSVYFSADGGDGRELYVATGGDVRQVVDTTPGSGDESDPEALARVGRRLVYDAADTLTDPAEPRLTFFATDGSAAGTVALPTDPLWRGYRDSHGGQDHGVLRQESSYVWTDGTPAGTRTSHPGDLLGPVSLRGSVAVGAVRVHFSDTQLVRSRPGSETLVTGRVGRSEVDLFAPADALPFDRGWLFTARARGEHDRGLWWVGVRGTARQVMAASGSVAVPLLADRGTALLRVHRPQDGDELWRSDGTAAGTTRIADLAGGRAGSQAAEPVVVGDRIYFAADDRVTGRELWSMPRDLLGPLPDTRVTDRPARRTTSTTAVVRFRATVTGSTFECRLDRGAWRSCTTPWRSQVAVGRHRLDVRATTPLGVGEAVPASVRWRVGRMSG